MTMPAPPSNPTPGQSFGTWGTQNNGLWNWLKGVIQTVWDVAYAAETPTGAQGKVNTAISGLSTVYEARVDRTGKAINDVVALQANGTLGLTTPGTGGGTIPDATTSTKGVVILAGDLAGTAVSPQIAAGVIVNADVNATAAISLDKTADGTRLAMIAAERTKLTGVATAATANSTDAQLRDRATHTGTQSQSTVASLPTDLAARALLANVVTGGTARVTGGAFHFWTQTTDPGASAAAGDVWVGELV